VLTPHAGELVRLLARYGQVRTRAEVDGNPTAAALLAAKLTGQTVVLKGATTVVATPDRCVSCEPGPADLATAGTGDVLAGIIGALLATNLEDLLTERLSLLEVVTAGVELHAAAARLAAEAGPIGALDVAEAVREIIRRARA
jgi:NAD(P)H-hydrate repair Nnr-like enzyme with NAD(P)H-hydrate dehydratase domain